MTDIEIVRNARLKKITDIAREANIPEAAVIPYGRHMAKINPALIENKGKGKLILVSAITPTPAGEGKTTTSIGLTDGLKEIGKKAVLALREPSLGPVFGMKGGAAGGGYAQVLPMEEINLHFTGDLHAVTCANNLLAALVDNHIQQGNALGIDPRRIVWRRCMDMNDRQLRNIVSGLGGRLSGMPREDGFDITAASEVMAVLCLADDLEDLKRRLSEIVVGYTYQGAPVRAQDLSAQGAMATLLKQAIMPNLVQTMGGSPALVHGGPFANIAHGCNSVSATKLAMALGDYAVTEAGFGADLGAEKFMDIKCRLSGISPDASVLVATLRALKYHGGAAKENLDAPDIEALKKGAENLIKHIENLKDVFGLPVVVAVNRFSSDTEAELASLLDCCERAGVRGVVCNAWEQGGSGAVELAKAVVEACSVAAQPRFAYGLDESYVDKITSLAVHVYGAKKVNIPDPVYKELERLEKSGYGSLPVCIAKTQYSLSDDPALKGRPQGYTFHVRSVRLSAGAGFVVVFTGSIIAMPGLPKLPAAAFIDIDAQGVISGLF
ncbi:MAG: formate--tetrahydrofolate ligase [Christensenellales bacterium]|jgi:formate--tetrahydrofolate ligase